MPALTARHASNVQLISDSPTALQMKQCYQGKNIGAVYGDDLTWVGWEAVDEMNRIFEHPGKKPPPENTVWIIRLSPKYFPKGEKPPAGSTCPANGDFGPATRSTTSRSSRSSGASSSARELRPCVRPGSGLGAPRSPAGRRAAPGGVPRAPG